MGLQHALSLGFNRIGTVSSGNMAASVAAYGARTKLKTIILVKEDIPSEKIDPILIYHPLLIKVKGDYGQIYYESLKMGQELGIYFINSDIPFRVEGSKTIAFEICEQLDWIMPDFVIVPTSSGGNARGILKGFIEFYQNGMIDQIPRIVCVQLEGCAPIYQAWKNQKKEICQIVHPKTIDNAIANPFPPSGNEILRKLNQYDGSVITVSDQEAIDSQSLLAKEGIFAQPAATVSLAALKKLKHMGLLQKKDRCVAIITGSGLKYPGILRHYQFNNLDCNLEELKECIAENI